MIRQYTDFKCLYRRVPRSKWVLFASYLKDLSIEDYGRVLDHIQSRNPKDFQTLRRVIAESL